MPIGRPEATVAVIAHGAGSTGRFVAEAFGPALADAGIELVTFEDRSGDVAEVTATLAALVDGRGAQIVGGVSLGAHAAVAVAATRPWLAGAWLVLPAWTGPPGPVAALSALAAAEVTRDGLDVVLARLRGGPGWGGWVVAELRRAWPLYGGDSIARALAAARARGPPRPCWPPPRSGPAWCRCRPTRSTRLRWPGSGRRCCQRRRLSSCPTRTSPAARPRWGAPRWRPGASCLRSRRPPVWDRVRVRLRARTGSPSRAR